ncbi:MAG: hypothetical protein U9O89_02995 [Thermoproteota archaeon]|nr:hypothetical protein [Thermoproteota archaeon]
MAGGETPRYLVETDFLFGLREKDPLHQNVMKALVDHKEGRVRLTLSSASPLEVMVVALSQGVQLEQLATAIHLMDVELSANKVHRYLSPSLGDIRTSLRMRLENKELTLFDSLHAAAAKNNSLCMLSSDSIYDSLGVNRKDLATY